MSEIQSALRRALLVAPLLAGCGAPPASGVPAGVVSERPPIRRADPDRRSLQLYVVLTPDPKAMQGPGAVEAMWSAVGGDRPRYQAIRRHVRWVPGRYELDVTLDFADLPHPQVDAQALAAMLRALPPGPRAQAQAARLAVFVRSSARVLPEGNHIRLAGLAALYVAAAHLSRRQLRLAARTEPGGAGRLLTRGNPKYGVPDLVMAAIPPERRAAAQARFVAAQAALLEQGGVPGQRLRLRGGELTLEACPKGTYDAGCVQISPADD